MTGPKLFAEEGGATRSVMRCPFVVPIHSVRDICVIEKFPKMDHVAALSFWKLMPADLTVVMQKPRVPTCLFESASNWSVPDVGPSRHCSFVRYAGVACWGTHVVPRFHASWQARAELLRAAFGYAGITKCVRRYNG